MLEAKKTYLATQKLTSRAIKVHLRATIEVVLNLNLSHIAVKSVTKKNMLRMIKEEAIGYSPKFLEVGKICNMPHGDKLRKLDFVKEFSTKLNNKIE